MLIRVAMLAAGAVLGLWARAVAASAPGLSLPSRTSWGTIFLLVAGWSAMVAAVVVLGERRRSALLLYAVGTWWFVSELASPAVGTALAFTVGLVASALGLALVAHLGLSHPTGRLLALLYTIVVASGYAVMFGVLGLAVTSVFDPGPLGCAGCPRNLLLINGEPSLLDRVNTIGVRLGAAWLILAVMAAAWRVISAGTGAWKTIGLVAIGATVFLGASAVRQVTSLSAEPLGGGPWALVVWQVQGGCLLFLAAALGADVWWARRARRDLTRLVVELQGASSGGLREALAERLGDPELLIAYPIDDGRRYVDAEGHGVVLAATADRQLTHLVRGGTELATLAHRSGALGPAQPVDDLVASIQLALESERLVAEDLAQLAEIRSSGTRIVAAGDAERRRIERDLHDGAQQRLVALLLTLRLIRGEDTLPALAGAETELRRAIADLRQLAHGVYPVLLKDAGLRAAFEALAETRRLTLEGAADERYSDVVESTIYLLVAHLSDAGPTRLRITPSPFQLSVEITVEGQSRATADLDDRIRTLGGRLELITVDATTQATLTLPL